MNRKIFFSGLSIVASMALMAGSAFAAFPVSATSTGSTFSSASPSLELCNDNNGVLGSCNNQIPSPINVANIIPGTDQTFIFWIKNTGTDTLSNFTGIFNNPTGTGHGLSSVLETDLSVLLNCDATSNNGHTTNSKFNIWESNKTITGATLAPGTASRCIMTVGLSSGNTTDANQTLNFNAVFNAVD